MKISRRRVIAAWCLVVAGVSGCATSASTGQHTNKYCSWEFDAKQNKFVVEQGKEVTKCAVSDPKPVELYIQEDKANVEKVIKFNVPAEFESQDVTRGVCRYWRCNAGGCGWVVYPC